MYDGSASGELYLDTPRVITDTQGNTVWQWDNIDPFGNNVPNENPSGLGAFVNNLGFPGQYRDRETNTFYNYFRDAYDPALGRYTQFDPLGLAAGINGFIYVKDNPISYTDPKGLNPGMGGGTDSCDHYTQRCAPSGGTSYYYCQMAQSVCNMPVPTKWWRCVRKCLQDYDKACSRCSDGSPNKQCTTEAHGHCWTECSE